MTHPEIEAEQRYVERCYARLEALRDTARVTEQRTLGQSASGTFQNRLERDILAGVAAKRVKELDIGDEPLVFGRLDTEAGETFYIGRVAVYDEEHDPLVVDWRAPAAEPFYRATAVDPMGVVRRRHLLCHGSQVVALDDDLLGVAAPERKLELVGEAALLDALDRSRTGRMRDIVATIQREQDEVIRSPLDGVLVVQGGPGTGKTAVALHRAAYLLYTHRKRLERDGVLLIGPNAVFLRYIEQVLPALGEGSVVLATTATLQGGENRPEDPADVAVLKGDERMALVVRAAVAERERPIEKPVRFLYDGEVFALTRRTARKIVVSTQRAEGPHNARRALVRRSMLQSLWRAWQDARRESIADGARGPVIRMTGLGREERDRFEEEIGETPAFVEALNALWPLLTPAKLIEELFSDPARLEHVAGGILETDEIALLQRTSGLSRQDAPLLDEADVLLGPLPAPPKISRDAELDEEERWAIERMLDDLSEVDPLIRADRGWLAGRYLERRRALESSDDTDSSRSTYGHVLVDEAQDLSPMEWRMLLRRVPDGSMTIVGDLAQATVVRSERWDELLAWAEDVRIAELTINYRTPSEVMDYASNVLRVSHPGLEPPQSARTSGREPEVRKTSAAKLVGAVAQAAEAAHERHRDGRVAILTPTALFEQLRERFPVGDAKAVLEAPVVVLRSREAKGLEFDAVVVVEPAALVEESGSLGPLYVALTRPTQELTVVHAQPLPEPLAAAR